MKTTLIYFSCLGAGFIIYELVFIQIFMKLIGFPLYTYSTIVFILLFSAGTGSFFSPKIGVSPTNKWLLPFVGIIISSLIILLSHDFLFNIFLSSSLLIRIFVSTLLIFPLGFFLGMPFPLGIKTLENQPKGAIAWAWGMNGLFTVVGGLLSALLSIFIGFKITILIAIVFYIIAVIAFSRIRKTNFEIS
jgi:predicted membrane-bound spermidine synthase